MTRFKDKKEGLSFLRSYDKKIKLRKASDKDLCALTFYLPIILRERPELKEDAFETWNKAIECPKNTRYSVEDTYSSLTNVILDDKSMIPQAFNIYQKALLSEKNDIEALRLARDTLQAIAQTNSTYTPKAAHAFVKALDAYEDRITPKTPLQKFLQYVYDMDRRSGFIKEGIHSMREQAKSFVSEGPKNKISKDLSNGS